RNRNWVPQVKALLERDEDTLVVVGALHLVGERGLIALLEREGLRPRPYRP
ncbi:MAG: TraB/GumN family protein, partial [Gammaproteobacteria bacterium]|nr:TraB/GumN family protein [Gammaproteobacteria bacterium]